MSLASQWLDMARESLDAAKLLADRDKPRPAANRAYYAGYQAATALIHQNGTEIPPTVDGEQRESWSHTDTPTVLINNTRRLPLNGHRNRLAGNLSELYRLRVSADYISTDRIVSVDDAISQAGQLLKIAETCCS